MEGTVGMVKGSLEEELAEDHAERTEVGDEFGTVEFVRKGETEDGLAKLAVGICAGADSQCEALAGVQGGRGCCLQSEQTPRYLNCLSPCQLYLPSIPYTSSYLLFDSPFFSSLCCRPTISSSLHSAFLFLLVLLETQIW